MVLASRGRGALACDATNNACYATVAEGEACERYGAARARCASNATCLTSVRGDLDGTCVRNGTALFSTCSDTAPCTGAGLSCHAAKWSALSPTLCGAVGLSSDRSDGQFQVLAAKARKPQPNRIRDRATNTCIHLIEHQGRR